MPLLCPEWGAVVTSRAPLCRPGAPGSQHAVAVQQLDQLPRDEHEAQERIDGRTQNAKVAAESQHDEVLSGMEWTS